MCGAVKCAVKPNLGRLINTVQIREATLVTVNLITRSGSRRHFKGIKEEKEIPTLNTYEAGVPFSLSY